MIHLSPHSQKIGKRRKIFSRIRNSWENEGWRKRKKGRRGVYPSTKGKKAGLIRRALGGTVREGEKKREKAQLLYKGEKGRKGFDQEGGGKKKKKGEAASFYQQQKNASEDLKKREESIQEKGKGVSEILEAWGH